MPYVCAAYIHQMRNARTANNPLSGIFIPLFGLDIRYHTPVVKVNASPTAFVCVSSGKGDTVFYRL